MRLSHVQSPIFRLREPAYYQRIGLMLTGKPRPTNLTGLSVVEFPAFDEGLADGV
jgi:hypothetical protein